MGRRLQEFKAEINAMGRELVKDVRQTVHEVYANKQEHGPEPGTPLNLTQREIYENKHQNEPGKDMEAELDM